MTDNYYEDLGVEPGATRDELRDAHRQRLSDLEDARGKKGFSESQLQSNRDEAARVRAAWNVLSDPFQRQRYDAKLSEGESSGTSGDVELVDDDEGGSTGTGTELTGWRKLLAPPPPKEPTGNGNGNGIVQPKGRTDRNGRPRPEPTVQLPAGMTLAEPRTRGMALLFDISILIVIFFSVSLIVPKLIQSDYQDIQDRITKVNDLKSAREDLTDAQESVADAKGASETKSAQSDLKDAQQDYASAQKDARKEGATNVDGTPKQLQTQADKLSDDIKTTGYVVSGLIFVLGLAYLVPVTALKGRTLGMRGRRIKVVRVDGSPVGWYASFTRFALPLVLAIAIPSFGVLLGLGMVAWGYFDRNGQGIHDKLSRTLVVDA